MPFDRWVTMLEHLKRFGMDSPDLLASHYLRGFNYATQMFSEVGEDNPVLQAKVEQVFALMDSSIVLNCPKLSRKRKRWYFNVRGESCPHIPVMSRLRYLVSEALFRAGVRAL